MDVAVAYVELLRAECRRAITLQIRADAAEVARLTSSYAKTGEGRKADADRAATELANRETDLLEFEGDVLTRSARLAELLNLDPSIRLHPTDGWVVPSPMVPAPIPLSELIGTAMLQRPELAAQCSAIRESFLALRAQQILPFSPQMMVGFSSGGFGGGSNRQDLGAQSLFGNFDSRVDIDVVTYWTLQNMGLGNRAMISATAPAWSEQLPTTGGARPGPLRRGQRLCSIPCSLCPDRHGRASRPCSRRRFSRGPDPDSRARGFADRSSR